MLAIRPQQMRAFSARSEEDFIDRMLAHVRQFFPDAYSELDEAARRELIRSGIERARRYELLTERDICRFITLMFALDRDFDTRYAWAAGLLSPSSGRLPSVRMAHVYAIAVREHAADAAEQRA